MELLFILLRLRNKFCFCLRIKPTAMAIFMFALFASMSMTVGLLIVCFTSPKSSITCQRSFKQMVKNSTSFSSQPRSVAVGDINNDNQIDIIVTNSGKNTIGIFLSSSNRTFTNQTTLFTGSGSNPRSIIINDLNNDSYLDIVVANYGNNNIGIFIGHGNGHFDSQKLISTGSSHPLFITMGDFNNDNRLDIVVANYGTDNVGVLLGYGNGSFQDQATYSTGSDSNPHSLAVGDFNNDTHLDITIANYGTNNAGILLGYGNGTFRSQQTYTTLPKSNPSSITVGDFNNDHQLDIAVANNGTGNLGLFLGHGNGTFLPQTTYPISFNSHPQYITVGHFNKDNELDIVIVDSQNDRVHILLGYGNGSFATLTTFDTIRESRPSWIAVADFNNDNQSDLVVANYGANNVLILVDYSTKPSARQMNYHVGPPRTTASIAVGDFNNDHILDLVFGANGHMSILTGLGSGTFDRKTIYSIGNGLSPQYVCVGDLNNDNRMDVIIADTHSNNVGVFLGHGDGTLGAVTTYSSGIGSKPGWIALGDVNNDNRLDIVSTNRGISNVGILFGNGDGTFAAMVHYSTGIGSTPNSVAVGDINNDNHLDIVVTNWGSNVTILLGNGNGTFIIVMTYFTGGNLASIALADFNSDYHLDFVVANTGSSNVAVFLGFGNGMFAPQTTHPTGSASQPYYVLVADFNNDNISDLAATNFGSDQVVIFYGYGNGSFQLTKRVYPTGFGTKPYAIAVADFNNDKQLEIVVALWGPGDIAVLTEYQAAAFANQTIYSTGSALQPVSLAVGDFNNDNRSAIVVANSGTDSLGIQFGLGNSMFGMEMIYFIGHDSHPQYVITCDINKDNATDIVSVNSKSDSISVIMGYGNGSFGKQMKYSTGNGSHPYAIASGDFNNDNRLDFVVAKEGTDSIGIFLGFDYTSFQNQETYSTNDSLAPWGIVVSDFNNDNIRDMAVVFQAGDSLGVLLGYGDGSFTTMMIYSTGNGSQPLSIAVGDFNNDSQSDIVVTNFGINNIGILLGYGNGSFATIETYSTGDLSNPMAVAVGDFNNDSQLDIAVGSFLTSDVGVFLGYGNGIFAIVSIYSNGIGSGTYAVTVDDFNNDGNLDIVTALHTADRLGLFLGNGDGTFRNEMILSTGYNSIPYWVAFGDFNSDNHLDIATTNSNYNNIGIFLGYGNGTFARIKYYSTGTGSLPRGISVGDFNNDDILDIAIANSGTNTIVVLFGFGDGSFLLGTAYSTGIGSFSCRLAIGDFNNDTRLDIAVTNLASNNIGIFLSYDSEPLAGVTTYSTGYGSQPHSVAVGDFNDDNQLDIVVTNYGTNNVGIFLGYSNGSFGTIMKYATGNGSAPYSVAVGDFNNDAQLDFVVTNSDADNVAVYLGFGNGSFAIPLTYSTETRSRPLTVAIGDLNNDNILDIIVANSGTNNVFLLYGNMNGTFGNEVSYPLGYDYRPYSVAVTDLNQDNRMDIVIACYGTDRVETLIKMC